MNKRKLLNLAKKIEKVPPQNFNMASWVVPSDKLQERLGYDTPISAKDLSPECGTTMCIAGWQQAFKGRKLLGSGLFDRNGHYVSTIARTAREDLELTEDEGNALFYKKDWIGQFPNTPQGAADYIRYFVKNYSRKEE